MPYTGTLDASKPTVFPHGIQAVVVGSDGAQQGAIVDLTDSTGGSGTHNDTLAAVTTFTPSVAWDGASVYPSAADATAIATAITVLNQNSSDLAQKVLEILAALRGAGIIAT